MLNLLSNIFVMEVNVNIGSKRALYVESVVQHFLWK